MDPFERHGIQQLSPSSLAVYRHSGALWCLRYLFGVREEESAHAWRGRAVEAGINAIVLDEVADDVAIEKARRSFELSAQGELSPEINRNRHAISEMVRRAAILFRQLGKPVATQQRVEHWLDGIEIPIVGYCDYVYKSFVVDLKTTFALPSKPRSNDAIQVVFYGDVLSRRPGLIYVTPRKTGVYPYAQIDIEGARRLLRQSADALRSMLAATDDKQHAASLFVPNPDDFRWTETMRAAADGVWL